MMVENDLKFWQAVALRLCVVLLEQHTHMMVENDLNSGRQWRCVFVLLLEQHTHT